MNLIKPVRAKGEDTYSWISRRDSYRLDIIENQLKQLQNDIKKLMRNKK